MVRMSAGRPASRSCSSGGTMCLKQQTNYKRLLMCSTAAAAFWFAVSVQNSFQITQMSSLLFCANISVTKKMCFMLKESAQTEVLL